MKFNYFIGFLLSMSGSFCCIAQEENWYKCLAGTIGSYPITMHLNKMNHQYAGYYYYDSRQEPVPFIGEDTSRKGTISLWAFSNPMDSDERFFFDSNSKHFTGKWKINDTANTLTFTAMAVKDSALLNFSLVYEREETKLKPAEKDSPTADFEAASIWPAGSSAKAEFVRRKIAEAFQAKDATDLKPVFNQNKNQFFKDYREEYAEQLKQNKPEEVYAYSASVMDRFFVVFQSQKLLSVASYTYIYSGGAHGNYGTHYQTYNLAKKEVLTLNEIITKAGQQKLPSLLVKYFRKKYKLESTASLAEAGLFENHIPVSENYFVTGKGIGFAYTPYEIGPYSMGEIMIFIPFTELQSYLLPSFNSLR